MKRAVGILFALASSARADTVGVVATGDATLQPTVMSAFTQRLERGGHSVVAAPLPPQALGLLTDCLVIEDLGCARTVVERDARTPSVIFVSAEPTQAKHETRIVVHYFAKGKDAVVRRETCADCTDAKLVGTAEALVGALVADASTPAPVHAPRASVASPALERAGFAVGAELGEPTSATGGWYVGRLAVLAALGSGTLEGPGVSFHADVQMRVAYAAPQFPIRVGLGARYYHHGYNPMSVDEIPHTHYGLRASGAIAYERGPLELYAELAPGIDLKRSRSCNFSSGVDTVCPHAQQAPVFVQFVVGARWFISH